MRTKVGFDSATNNRSFVHATKEGDEDPESIFDPEHTEHGYKMVWADIQALT